MLGELSLKDVLLMRARERPLPSLADQLLVEEYCLTQLGLVGLLLGGCLAAAPGMLRPGPAVPCCCLCVHKRRRRCGWKPHWAVQEQSIVSMECIKIDKSDNGLTCWPGP
eukprot:1144409-Pelagomonas_calceolata.AAC.11